MKRIALITGAGSGIGRRAALALARSDWTLVLAGRREPPLKETARMAAEQNADTLVVPTDVANPDDVDSLFERIASEYQRLDLLFNNAGVNIPPTSPDEIAVDDWRRVVDTNLTGMFLCIRGAFRLMKQQSPQGGRIINNGSISAHAPRPGSLAYTATKHAVSGLTKAASLDGRAFDIACGQIDIGNALTEMAAKIEQGVPQPDGSTRPEPTIDADHVAAAVAYMAELPLDANVPFMTVMANRMPYMGRG